ncbi:MAG: glycoside hydrolase family 68 protein [Sphingomonadales bacterium]|nr:glycoside hydrolase family 68 protein [Sphingomonadales bacterium]
MTEFTPTDWTPEQVATLRIEPCHVIPAVDPAALATLIPGLDLWDLWPLQNADGTTARFDGWTLWFVLSAPALDDPEARHAIARIRLMGELDGVWRDHGNALPDGLNPGSREWAGSARFDAATRAVTLYWTAAGYTGEAASTFAQRMFETTGMLTGGPDAFTIDRWTPAREIAGGPIPHYILVTQAEGVPGFIKGFRDPAFFRDPADGAEYLLFTGSMRDSRSAWNGCIGLLRADANGWDVLPPLLCADGLNNEQERPHIVHHAGRYYLFWSTQRKVFAPDGPNGPNGLYGMVADDIAGPWRPLNGSGLVAGNPADAPFQTYSWWVTAELTVHGFVDYPASLRGNDHGDAAWRRAQFGGVPAPVFTVALDGDKAGIATGS